eukprot:3943432-Pleurochrysis_carterae.AAC.5
MGDCGVDEATFGARCVQHVQCLTTTKKCAVGVGFTLPVLNDPVSHGFFMFRTRGVQPAI